MHGSVNIKVGDRLRQQAAWLKHHFKATSSMAEWAPKLWGSAEQRCLSQCFYCLDMFSHLTRSARPGAGEKRNLHNHACRERPGRERPGRDTPGHGSAELISSWTNSVISCSSPAY
eukprot:1146321-Pelagomonas_calceolata.AAC.2